jgi:ABC-type uncharacterized transport system fused permease/ATPase subunit
MLAIGRRFVAVEEGKIQSEAEYRYMPQRVRENGESIALLGGDRKNAPAPTARLSPCFSARATCAFSTCAPRWSNWKPFMTVNW